jgi:hypothetical protein
LIYGILSLIIYGVYNLDKYLKNTFNNDPNFLLNHGGNYEFWLLILILTIIVVWCTYLRFNIAFMKRQKLIWVEVQDYLSPENSVTRNQAKKNLRFVYEKTLKVQKHSNLFDFYWYEQRQNEYSDVMTDEWNY